VRESPLQKTPYEEVTAAELAALTAMEGGAAAGAIGLLSASTQQLEPRVAADSGATAGT
jgi:hypothetical protein